MSTLVESMKRLYKSGKITKEQVEERLNTGKISQSEYEYIVRD
jgi:hypothetical protein